jgi:hypothetical protein
LNRHEGTLTQMPNAGGVAVAWIALQPVQGREKLLENLGEQYLLEAWIGARSHDIGVCNHRTTHDHAHQLWMTH